MAQQNNSQAPGEKVERAPSPQGVRSGIAEATARDLDWDLALRPTDPPEPRPAVSGVRAKAEFHAPLSSPPRLFSELSPFAEDPALKRPR